MSVLHLVGSAVAALSMRLQQVGATYWDMHVQGFTMHVANRNCCTIREQGYENWSYLRAIFRARACLARCTACKCARHSSVIQSSTARKTPCVS